MPSPSATRGLVKCPSELGKPTSIEPQFLNPRNFVQLPRGRYSVTDPQTPCRQALARLAEASA
jgi:hypothetical protein